MEDYLSDEIAPQIGGNKGISREMQLLIAGLVIINLCVIVNSITHDRYPLLIGGLVIGGIVVAGAAGLQQWTIHQEKASGQNIDQQR